MPDFIPVYYPPVTNQFSQMQGGTYNGYWGDHQSCVGHAIANVLQVVYYKHTGTLKNFSYVYIFAKRRVADYQGEERVVIEALECLGLQYFGFKEYSDCPGDGFYEIPDNYNTVWANRYWVYLSQYSTSHPPAQMQGTDYIDLGASYTSARTRVTNSTGSIYNAIAYSTSDEIATSNISTIQNVITTHGAILLFISGTYSLYDTENDNSGIVVDEGTSEDVANHLLCVIGWKTINGVLHWICVNSWGTDWANNGYCYIPYDASFMIYFYRIRYNTSPGSNIPEPPEVIGDKFEGSATFHQTFNYGVSRKLCFIEEGDTSVISYNFPIADSSIHITDLYESTTYSVYTETTVSNGGILKSAVATFTMLPLSPVASNFSYSSKTLTSITFHLMRTSGNGYFVKYKNAAESTWTEVFISNLSITLNYGSNYTFDNLTSGEIYTFQVWNRDILSDGTSYQDSLDYLQYLISTTSRPDNWIWTTNELSVFNNHGSTAVLTYSRWNDFIDRVNEFRIYKAYSELPTSVTVNGDVIPLKMSSSDKIIYAERFNVVRYGIGELYSTGITDRTRNDTIYGSYFITLANSLNNIT